MVESVDDERIAAGDREAIEALPALFAAAPFVGTNLRGARVVLRALLGRNGMFARAYPTSEELREIVFGAPDRAAMEKGLDRIHWRTRRYEPRALRGLHDALNERENEIVASPSIPRDGRLESRNDD